MFELHWKRPVRHVNAVEYQTESVTSSSRWTLFGLALDLEQQGCANIYCVIHGKVFIGFEALNMSTHELLPCIAENVDQTTRRRLVPNI